MTFKKYEGFVVNESETKDQVMADAKLMVETLQAQETDPAVGWYINIVHPKRMYCSVIISNYLRQQFPTIAKNIDLYDEDEFLHDLSIVNSRIDILSSQYTTSKTKLDATAITATTAKDNADSALIKATQAYTLAEAASSASGGASTTTQSTDFKLFFYGGF